MNAMKLLLSLIVLCCLRSSPAETASAFRYFFNPFSWFASSANRTQSAPPALPSHANLRNNFTASIAGQNGSESKSDPARDSLKHGQMASSEFLAVTPLKIEPLAIRVNETADLIQVLVPTQVAPLLSSTEAPSVKRFGLIRETEIPEGREEVELQTTTVPASPDLRKEDPHKRIGTASKTDNVKTSAAKPSDSSTETGTTDSSTASEKTASTSAEASAAEPLFQTDKLLVQENGDDVEQIPAVTTDLSTTTADHTTSLTGPEPETSTQHLPLYVSAGPQKHIQLQLTDDFVHFLSKQYYERPLFNDVVVGLR